MSTFDEMVNELIADKQRSDTQLTQSEPLQPQQPATFDSIVDDIVLGIARQQSLQEPDAQDKIGFWENIERGGWGGFFDKATLGVKPLIEAASLFAAVNRFQDDRYNPTPKGDGERETDREKIIGYLEEQAEIAERGKTIGAKVGDIVGAMLPFMAEFIATGGVSAIGKKAVTKGVLRLVNQFAGKAGASAVGKLTARKATAKLAGWVTAAGIRTALTPHRSIQGFIDERMPNIKVSPEGQLIFKQSEDSPFRSAYKAIGNQLIEMASEESGAFLGVLGGKVINKLLPKKAITALNKLKTAWVNAVGGRTALDFANKALKKGGLNSMLEEMGEERLGALMRVAGGIDDGEGSTFEKIGRALYPGAEQLFVEMIAFSVPSIGRVGIAKAFSRKEVKDELGIDRNTSAEERQGLADKFLPTEAGPETDIGDVVPETPEGINPLTGEPVVPLTPEQLAEITKGETDAERIARQAGEAGAEVGIEGEAEGRVRVRDVAEGQKRPEAVELTADEQTIKDALVADGMDEAEAEALVRRSAEAAVSEEAAEAVVTEKEEKPAEAVAEEEPAPVEAEAVPEVKKARRKPAVLEPDQIAKEEAVGKVEVSGVKTSPVIKEGGTAEQFEALGDAQRGKPESAMIKVTTHHSGVLGFVLEHVGDLTHRMTENVKDRTGGFGASKSKIERSFNLLTEGQFGRSFEEAHQENIVNNAKLRGPSESEFRATLKDLGEKYSAEHAKLPVFNEVQQRARDAAIALGKQDFETAREHITWLKNLIDKGKDAWSKAALENLTAEPAPKVKKGRKQPKPTTAKVTPKKDVEAAEKAVSEQPTGKTLPTANNSVEVDETLGKALSVKNLSMKEVRDDLGLGAVPSAQRKAQQTSVDNAIAKNIPADALRIATEVQENPRQMSDEEEAGLLVRSVQLRDQYEGFRKKILETKDEAEKDLLNARMDRVEAEFDIISLSLKTSGTEIARALAFRRNFIDEHYDILSVKTRAKTAKGKPLSEGQAEKFEELVKELEEANRKLDEAIEKLDNIVAEQAVTAAKKGKGRAKKPAGNIASLSASINQLLEQGCV